MNSHQEGNHKHWNREHQPEGSGGIVNQKSGLFPYLKLKDTQEPPVTTPQAEEPGEKG
jgi:hypothetical protein